MQTLFLSGMSLRNKDWMEETIQALPEFDFIPVYWEHWQQGHENASEFAWDQELAKIQNLVNKPVNILAKSIGSVIASIAINAGLQTNKVVFCGLPFSTVPQAKTEIGECLKKLDPSKIHIIQNDHDPLCSYEEAVAFVKAINPYIQVHSQPREDHSYPYLEKFKEYLS